VTGRGSWPLLLAAVAVFAGAFTLLRGGSSFLAIERDHAAAAGLASRHGLPVVDVQALRDLVGVEAAAATWEAATVAYATNRAELGDGLAAMVAAGEVEAAPMARRRAADAEAAWQLFRTDPRAVPGLRFLSMRQRFADRLGTRD